MARGYVFCSTENDTLIHHNYTHHTLQRYDDGGATMILLQDMMNVLMVHRCIIFDMLIVCIILIVMAAMNMMIIMDRYVIDSRRISLFLCNIIGFRRISSMCVYLILLY